MKSQQFVATLLLIILCCAGLAGNQLLLVDDAGKPLARTRVSLFIDDGIRCVTTPCPTDSRTWFGTTDESGSLKLPSWGNQEDAYLSIPGFEQTKLTSRTGRLALTPADGASVLPLEILQVSYVSMGSPQLGITISNFSDEPITWVKPRPDRLERFASWGGWQLRVTLQGERFEPEPLPGGLPPATTEDLIAIPAGGYHYAIVDVGHWRRMPLDSKRTVGDQPGSYHVELEWTGIPWNLSRPGAAPPRRAKTTLKVAPR